MPFDEELRRQFEALTDRIRAEVARQLALATDELTAVVSADRAAAIEQAASDARSEVELEAGVRLTAAVAAAEHRGRAEGLGAGEQNGLVQGRLEGRTEGVAEGRAEGLAEGRAEGVADGRAEGIVEGRAEGIAEGRAEGRTEGRAEGLEEGRAEGHAAGFADGRIEGHADGFEEGRDHARAEARAKELAAGERLVEAVRAIDGAGSLSEILDTLASQAGRDAARVGVLLVHGGSLRGWRFIGFDAAFDEGAAFELPVDQAGLIAEAIGSGEAVSADSGQRTAVPAFAHLPPGREMLAVPIPMNGQVVAVLYADQAGDDASRPGHASPVIRPAVLEVLARHATRCLETVTAFRAAQILTERTEASVAAWVSGGSTADRASGPANVAGAGDEDEAARRYARLLISDIKLYHEPEVIAGRRDRDVAIRLGGEIARARVLYEQRVPGHVRDATDHFQAELVRTLADGDPSVLGQAT